MVLQNSDLWWGNQKKIPVNILARKNKKHSVANAITVAGVTEALLIGQSQSQSQSQFSWLTSPPQVWCPGGTELRTGRRTTFAPWSPPPRTCSPHWMWRPVWPTSVSPSLPNKHPPSPRAQTTRLNRVAAGLVSWLMTVISLLLIVMKTPGKYYQLENYTINILSRSVPMYKTRILLHLVSSILVSPLLYRIYQQAAGLLKHLDDSVDQGRWLGLSHCCRLHSYFTAFHCQTDLFSKLLLFPKIIFEVEWNNPVLGTCNNLHPEVDKISSVAPACYKCEGKTWDSSPARHPTSYQPSPFLAKPDNYLIKNCFISLSFILAAPEIFHYKLQDYSHSWPRFFPWIQILRSQILGEFCPQVFGLLKPNMVPEGDMAWHDQLNIVLSSLIYPRICLILMENIAEYNYDHQYYSSTTHQQWLMISSGDRIIYSVVDMIILLFMENPFRDIIIEEICNLSLPV